MKINKICFVGYGSHVEKTIIPSLSLKNNNIKIITTKPIVTKFEIFPNLKSAINQIDRDFIFYNSTPPAIHFLTSKLIISNGYNLIIEKPICLNVIQLNKLRFLADLHNVFIFENMMYFYSKQFSIFNKYININSNKINSININFCIPNFNKNSFRSNTNINSSLLYDVACYPFSLISYLGFNIYKYNFSYKYKNKILNHINISFYTNNINFTIIVSFFIKYQNYVKVILNDSTSLQFNHFFYGKKLVKNNILILPNKKIKVISVNDYDVFKKIFSYDISKLHYLSKDNFIVSHNYLKMLNRLKKHIKK